MRKLGLFSFTSSVYTFRFLTCSVLWVSLFPLVFPPFDYAQSGARTVARSIDQLADESEIIVRGRVVSAHIEPHPQLRNLMTVAVSMSITDTYKGTPRKSIVFRQFIWNADSKRSSAEYQKGQELILLLRPVSEYGLTSPAGLEQGRFNLVAKDKAGQKFAVNGRGNLGLFDQVQEKARARGVRLSPHSALVTKPHVSGPLPVEDLEDVLRGFSERH
jgi:hypothetical protein